MRLSLRNKCLFLMMGLILSGCGISSYIAKNPEIYSIQVGDVPLAEGQKKLSTPTSITLADFTENTMVATIRIPLLTAQNRVRYIENATWVDTPGVMINQQLNESLQNNDHHLIVANYQERMRSQYMVQGQVMRFYYNQATQEVDIRLELKLVRMPDRKAIEDRQFAIKVKVPEENLSEIIAAFNKGSKQIISEIQNWVYAQLA